MGITVLLNKEIKWRIKVKLERKILIQRHRHIDCQNSTNEIGGTKLTLTTQLTPIISNPKNRIVVSDTGICIDGCKSMTQDEMIVHYLNNLKLEKVKEFDGHFGDNNSSSSSSSSVHDHALMKTFKIHTTIQDNFGSTKHIGTYFGDFEKKNNYKSQYSKLNLAIKEYHQVIYHQFHSKIPFLYKRIIKDVNTSTLGWDGFRVLQKQESMEKYENFLFQLIVSMILQVENFKAGKKKSFLSIELNNNGSSSGGGCGGVGVGVGVGGNSSTSHSGNSAGKGNGIGSGGIGRCSRSIINEDEYEVLNDEETGLYIQLPTIANDIKNNLLNFISSVNDNDYDDDDNDSNKNNSQSSRYIQIHKLLVSLFNENLIVNNTLSSIDQVSLIKGDMDFSVYRFMMINLYDINGNYGKTIYSISHQCCMIEYFIKLVSCHQLLLFQNLESKNNDNHIGNITSDGNEELLFKLAEEQKLFIVCKFPTLKDDICNLFTSLDGIKKYCIHMALNTSPIDRIVWVDNSKYTSLIIDGVPVSIHDLSTLAQYSILLCEKNLESLLPVDKSDLKLPQPIESNGNGGGGGEEFIIINNDDDNNNNVLIIKDNYSSLEHGYSFLKDSRNYFNHCELQGYERLLKNSIVFNMFFTNYKIGETIKSINSPFKLKDSHLKNSSKSYFKRSDSFLENLLLAIYLTCGQPPRSTEIISLNIRNNGSISRNLFWINNRVALIVGYNKTFNIHGKLKYIARFIPYRLSKVLIEYLVYVRPFEQHIISKLFDVVGSNDKITIESEESKLYKNQLFIKQFKEMKPTILSNKIKETCFDLFGKVINLNQYRHCIIAFSTKFFNLLLIDNDDDNDNEESESGGLHVDDLESVNALFPEIQAGHTKTTSEKLYAVSNTSTLLINNHLDSDKLDFYLKCSKSIHSMLKVTFQHLKLIDLNSMPIGETLNHKEFQNSFLNIFKYNIKMIKSNSNNSKPLSTTKTTTASSSLLTKTTSTSTTNSSSKEKNSLIPYGGTLNQNSNVQSSGDSDSDSSGIVSSADRSNVVHITNFITHQRNI
ncbi:hypothetical protein CYY_010272, partial [Polysphondylium violaceum]